MGKRKGKRPIWNKRMKSADSGDTSFTLAEEIHAKSITLLTRLEQKLECMAEIIETATEQKKSIEAELLEDFDSIYASLQKLDCVFKSSKSELNDSVLFCRDTESQTNKLTHKQLLLNIRINKCEQLLEAYRRLKSKISHDMVEIESSFNESLCLDISLRTLPKPAITVPEISTERAAQFELSDAGSIDIDLPDESVLTSNLLKAFSASDASASLSADFTLNQLLTQNEPLLEDGTNDSTTHQNDLMSHKTRLNTSVIELDESKNGRSSVGADSTLNAAQKYTDSTVDSLCVTGDDTLNSTVKNNASVIYPASPTQSVIPFSKSKYNSQMQCSQRPQSQIDEIFEFLEKEAKKKTSSNKTTSQVIQSTEKSASMCGLHNMTECFELGESVSNASVVYSSTAKENDGQSFRFDNFSQSREDLFSSPESQSNSEPPHKTTNNSFEPPNKTSDKSAFIPYRLTSLPLNVKFHTYDELFYPAYDNLPANFWTSAQTDKIWLQKTWHEVDKW